ncbi:MAG: glycosyltransferase, partial [Anaerolineales bacterium]
MRILFLAPQPFYEERGTPIAVNMLLKVLSERGEEVDLITYHLGDDVEYENVALHRIGKIPFIKTISPGFSPQKLICDFFLFWKAITLLSKFQYQVTHAVEESAFMALLFKKIWGIEYVYDMDSRLSSQLIDKYPILGSFSKVFAFMENKVLREAELILPVNHSLVDDFEDLDPDKVIELHDVSLLQNGSGEKVRSIKAEMGLNGILVMYVGNLEKYQGIDLLLESLAEIATKTNNINLAIIGGKAEDIQKYEEKTGELGIFSMVRFFGPRPMKNLGDYLSEADILVSPRISGANTPMKIYSFLESGKAIVATNLNTHTQVLNDQVAILVEPNPHAFAKGIIILAENAELRKRLGKNGRKLALDKYTFAEFQSSVNRIYDLIDPIPAI